MNWGKKIMRKIKTKKAAAANSRSIFIRYSIFGGAGIVLFYFTILYLVTKDISHPIQQFKLLNPWIGMLVIGFALQTGIFALMKKGIMFNISGKEVKGTAGAGMAMSSASMVACCAHHLTDLLPIMGISAAAVFLSDYQREFLIIGVLFNFFGLLYISWIITGKAKPKFIFNYLLKNFV